jgi:UV DNA damage repair endonuclease
MVTPQEMRLFALDCLRWADETANASHRDLMIRIAKTWTNTASTIERHVSNGGELVLPDLRSKLN